MLCHAITMAFVACSQPFVPPHTIKQLKHSRTEFMSSLRICSIIVVLSVLFAACIEKIDPQDFAYQSVLVADGAMTDKSEPYVVRLSRSLPLNTEGYLAESGAVVSIIDGEGQSYFLRESATGVYQSDPQEIVGVVGFSYMLDIVTVDGRHYQSDPVVLRASPAIDSVYFERERRLTDLTGITKDGVKILVDSHDPLGSTRYYRYEWTETYEIKVPYPSPYTYDVGNPGDPFVRTDVLAQFCYNSFTGSNILVATTKQLVEDRVTGLETNYVSTDDYKLRSKYSILVRQFALDEKGYKFWSELQKTSESLGTLFDPMPYELRGNISNVDDPDEAVLGYFDASAAAEKRLFIDREELLELEFPSDGCLSQLDTATLDQIPGFLNAGSLIAYLGPYPVTYALMGPPSCTDCRVHGSLEKPDFWPR